MTHISGSDIKCFECVKSCASNILSASPVRENYSIINGLGVHTTINTGENKVFRTLEHSALKKYQ